MLLIDVIKKSFVSVVQNPTITLFLVLFLIVSNFLGSCIVSVHSKAVAYILLLCFFVFIAAFLSGWLQVIKESTKIDENRTKNYYPVFFEGCGKNVVSMLLGMIIYIVSICVVVFAAKEFAHHFFGSLDFIFNNPDALSQNSKSFMEYINNLSDDEKYTLYAWQLTFISVISLFNFLFLFYFSSIIYSREKNVLLKPVFAIGDSVKFVFKNFLPVCGLYLFVQILHSTPPVLNVLFPKTALFGIIILLLWVYFASYIVMLIFSYYEAKNCSDNRCDCIGQDKTIC